MSTQHEVVDCFNCAAVDRRCDKTRHRCAACFKNGQLCKGYPRNLQWLAGVRSRGKRKGQSLSIAASDRGWQSSSTPANQTFIFKRGRTHKKPRHGRHEQQRSTIVQSCDVVSPEPSLTGRSNGPRSPQELFTPGHDQFELDEASRAGGIDCITPFPDAGLWNLFEVSDTAPSDTTHSPSVAESLCDLSDGITPHPIHLESAWLDERHESVARRPPRSSEISRLSIPLISAWESSTLLTFYDGELCTVPLTSDFHGNPFRPKQDTLHGSKHLLHALLATSMQHVSRMIDRDKEDFISDRIIAYKRSATQLCSDALLASSATYRTPVMDTILVLFALDTMTSAVGPWKKRLVEARRKIESLGGITTEIGSSPRARAQLAMFIWWDCSVALLSRSEMVFPEAYDDLILSCDENASWNIFTLSGVPRELFRYCRELVQLASEKEQLAGMKYAIFDTARVLEVERCIKAYTQGEFNAQDLSVSGEDVQRWHDYYNASNAWKYALLLYICRVLEWDQTSDQPLAEVTSLARLILDSVKCCRSESPLQKQLLFPVFLAGSESADSYSREFVGQYCTHWYRECRYGMFKDALAVLQQLWLQKDRDSENVNVWWGSFIGSRHANPAAEFLFG